MVCQEERVVWQNIENLSSSQNGINFGSINCEFSLNLSDEAGDIHFSDDGLLSIGQGELGIQVYKQLDQGTCYKKIETEVDNNDFYIDISSNLNISGWPWSNRSIQADSNSEEIRILLLLKMDGIPQNIKDIKFYDTQNKLIEDMIFDDQNTSGNPNRLWFEKEDDYYYIKFKVNSDISRFQFSISDVSNLSLMTNQYFDIAEFNSTNKRIEKKNFRPNPI